MALFGGIGQAGRIREANASASEARKLVTDTFAKMRELEARLDHVTLVSTAVWEILREKTHTTEEELQARIADIDSRDGKIDGKLTAPPLTCVKCEKPLLRSQSRCMYCGADVPRNSVFEGR